ncbi:hypothetical protein [Elioraea sp.]|uniref:hypothetical protein n=1 Tax=Elioraea sp. TaxID=2185103 RepID=UPI00307DCF52
MHDWPPALQQQVRTLVRQFLAGGEAWIGIAGIEFLGVGGPQRTGTMRAGGRLEPLGNRPLDRAFVWVQGAEPELWADPRASSYRDLFDEFARTRLGLAGRPTTGFNIDHVFPKSAAAVDDMSHVRMLAIAAASNQAAGRTLEKAMKQRAVKAAGRKRIRHATWMTIGKATGFIGWESLPDSADANANMPLVHALFAHLAARGIPADFPDLEQRLTAHTLTRIR